MGVYTTVVFGVMIGDNDTPVPSEWADVFEQSAVPNLHHVGNADWWCEVFGVAVEGWGGGAHFQPDVFECTQAEWLERFAAAVNELPEALRAALPTTPARFHILVDA